MKHFLVFLLVFIGIGSVSAQQAKITGTVKDNTGETIIGANVTIKGGTGGTITDIDGHFSIDASTNATLVISFIGYTTQEVALKGKTNIVVTLNEDSQALDEVIVIGYGTQKKVNLTGSVSAVKIDEAIASRSISNVSSGLSGLVPGLVVNQSTGFAGSDGASLKVRGLGSINNSDPLIVVDGMPDVDINRINMNDIESISVLKDAASSAVYGSRAANGVVIITTKSGAQGKARVQFSANFSMSKPVKLIDVLSAGDYAQFKNECTIFGYMYDGKNYVSDESLPYPIPGHWSIKKGTDPVTGEEIILERKYMPSPDDFRNGFDLREDGNLFYGTNWQKEIFRDAFSQEYSLNVSGGDQKGSYMYSGGYLDQQGVIVNSYYKRYNVRANNNRKINDYVEIGSNLTFTKSENRLARTNTENYGVIESAIAFNPTRPVFDPDADSKYSEDFASGLANPYLSAHTEKNVLDTYGIYASGFGEITFVDWLKFRQNIGYGYTYNERSQYYNRYTGSGQNPTNGYGRKDDNAYEGFTLESLLTFEKKFGVHAFNVVAGMTYEKSMGRSKYMLAKNFPNDITEDNDMNAAVGEKEIGSGRWRSQLMSYLARANYNLLDRYLFTASFRRDGSSRFNPLNRWSNFYSGAIAWRMSDEAFIKNLNFFDNLKLRFSAGQTGNQGISAYATRSRFEAQNYPFDGTMNPGAGEDRWGGPAAANLKWETTNQFNLGLDAAFFNNRVNLVVDLYYKKTTDLLQYRYIDMSSGFNQIACNYGDVTNKGLEITAHVIPVKTRDWMWTLDANISFNRNKIGGLNADQFSDVAWGIESMFLRRNGHPIGTLYGYVEDGFYDNEAEVRADPYYRDATPSKVKSMVGQVKYKNLDDDPVIDDRDKTIIGDTNPDYQYGITSTLNWKKWTFSFFLQGTQGNDILNVNLKQFDVAVGSGNMPYFVFNNRWTPENRAAAKWPRADGTFTRAMKASDRYIVDGSYLRCKNISLSYNWAHPVKFVESINIVASITNLFTISGYEWYDPDVNAFGSDPTRRGVDMSSYPSARTFNLGIQLAF